MTSKVTQYMVNELEKILDEADVLRLSAWGVYPNIKVQSALDRRKHNLTARIVRMGKFLEALEQEVEALQMLAGEQDDSSE